MVKKEQILDLDMKNAKDGNLETIIARLLVNTRTRKRPNNIVEIAEDIMLLTKELGGLNEVAKTIGISSQMLRKFLRVMDLEADVRKYVRSRKIDSVAIVDMLGRFRAKNQIIIAKEIMQGHLNVDNMKVLSAIATTSSEEEIGRLISRVRESEDKVIYVIKIGTRKIYKDFKRLEDELRNKVGSDNVVSFSINKSVCVLELNSLGKIKLIKAAKSRGLSLRKFINKMIREKSDS